MTYKITKALETVNELHGETLRNLDDNIQTVQIDYAEAMEMLWRQSQTIKRLQQENEKLRAEIETIHRDKYWLKARLYEIGTSAIEFSNVKALKETTKGNNES